MQTDTHRWFRLVLASHAVALPLMWGMEAAEAHNFTPSVRLDTSQVIDRTRGVEIVEGWVVAHDETGRTIAEVFLNVR